MSPLVKSRHPLACRNPLRQYLIPFQLEWKADSLPQITVILNRIL
jgi:hypothetical protein